MSRPLAADESWPPGGRRLGETQRQVIQILNASDYALTVFEIASVIESGDEMEPPSDAGKKAAYSALRRLQQRGLAVVRPTWIRDLGHRHVWILRNGRTYLDPGG